MKKIYLIALTLLIIILVSCGGAKQNPETIKDTQPPICDTKNEITLTIQNYMYEMSDSLSICNMNFEVKSSEYIWINDSTISLILSNYVFDELIGAKTLDQMDILLEINARNGQMLEPGVYGHNDYISGKYCRIEFQTAYGDVWFNGEPGVSDNGSITINHIDKKAICGTLSFNNDKPDDPMIGTVKANGTFVHKEVTE